jgi:hypothetical protein
MGRAIRLAVVACIVWAAWHAGVASWRQFEFSDAVTQIAQFGVDRDEDSVRAAVLEEAAKLDLPVTPKGVSIRRQERPAHLYIDVSYTAQIEILPRYTYPWTFTTNAHGWFVPGGRIPPRK